MKTLPEILRDAMLLLEDGREDVVIARGHEHGPYRAVWRADEPAEHAVVEAHEQLDGRSSAFQIRIQVTTSFGLTKYLCQSRSWLGAQWSAWRVQHGWLGGASFDIADVLATDWRITSCQS